MGIGSSRFFSKYRRSPHNITSFSNSIKRRFRNEKTTRQMKKNRVKELSESRRLKPISSTMRSALKNLNTARKAGNTRRLTNQRHGNSEISGYHARVRAMHNESETWKTPHHKKSFSPVHTRKSRNSRKSRT